MAGTAIQDQVFSRVSHELRTPFTVTHEFVALPNDGFAGPPNQEEQGFVRIAQRSATPMDRLVGDLLDSGRIAMGRLESWPRPIPLTQVVTDSSRSIAPAGIFDKIMLETGSVDRSLQVEADPDRGGVPDRGGGPVRFMRFRFTPRHVEAGGDVWTAARERAEGSPRERWVA